MMKKISYLKTTQKFENINSFFITAINTDIGKTLIASWICIHTKFPYYKLIQTGVNAQQNSCDSYFVEKITNTTIIPEAYKLKAPLSIYDAFLLDTNQKFDIEKLYNPLLDQLENIIIEGAGGPLVPVANMNNEIIFIADIIRMINSKAIIVTNTNLGFLHSTIATINAIKDKGVKIFGIIIINIMDNMNLNQNFNTNHNNQTIQIHIKHNIHEQSTEQIDFNTKNEPLDFDIFLKTKQMNQNNFSSKKSDYNDLHTNNIQIDKIDIFNNIQQLTQNNIKYQLLHTLELFSKEKIIGILNINKEILDQLNLENKDSIQILQNELIKQNLSFSLK